MKDEFGISLFGVQYSMFKIKKGPRTGALEVEYRGVEPLTFRLPV